jgi:hypothetical protein
VCLPENGGSPQLAISMGKMMITNGILGIPGIKQHNNNNNNNNNNDIDITIPCHQVRVQDSTR